ncbi:MAG: hypothetical protein ABJ370_05955 [Paracoccaceae bacterium]
MRRKNYLNAACVIAVLLISACSSQSPNGQFDPAEELSAYPRETFGAAGMQKRYSNATFLDYSREHGTQIEHLSSDGRAYLWYPGNKRMVVGSWLVRPNPRVPTVGEICFQYGPNTFNPVTQQRGGRLNCTTSGAFIIKENEYTRGDPLNLSSGQIPFVLAKDRKYSLPRIGAQLGQSVQLYR